MTADGRLRTDESLPQPSASASGEGRPSAVELSWDAWEHLMALTRGAAAPCFQCGVCTAICPWGLVRRQPFNLRKLMHRAQLGLDGHQDDLWLCTTCAACEALCPRGVQVSEVVLPLRQSAWQRRELPSGLSNVMWEVHWDGNPWGQPPSRRSDWAKGLSVRRFEPGDEALYYVGCTASYDPRTRKVARALAQTFQAAGVAFGTLGDDEPCCGDAPYSLGQLEYVDLLADRNTRLFRESGVSRIVTTSPHCFDMFRNHYPGLSGSVELVHYTQFLAQLVRDGRLRLEHSLDVGVTFHDPCYLGRRNAEYDAPREVLAAIPGLEVHEMEDSRSFGLCCGGGGGRMWLETAAGERFADLRVEQALRTQAGVLVTACPHCITCLEDAARSAGDLRIMDVAELVWLAVSGTPQAAAGRLT